MTFGRSMSARFALSHDVVMLNHGSFGACPHDVLAAQRAHRDAMETRPIVWMDEIQPRVRDIAGQVAARYGARARDLVLVDNATSGVNTVLRSLSLQPGDRLVTTTHAYTAVRNALHYVAERSGAEIVEAVIPFPLDDAQQVLDAVMPLLAGARLAVFDAITSPTGLVLPIEALVAACRAQGVPVLVDAAHVPGHLPLSLEQLDADWVTGNLHKWAFAPKGSAFLWARHDRQALVPLSVSHDLALGFPAAFDWTGTKDFTAWCAIPDAFAFVDGLGEEAVRAHNRGLCDAMTERLCARWQVSACAPPSMRAALSALPVPGGLGADRARWLHLALRARGIDAMCVPFAGQTWIRISAQIYNHEEQYDALGRAVMELVA